MSIKNVKEKREVEYETRKTLCDLCGTMIQAGSVKFRLSAQREEDQDRPIFRTSPDPLDICGADCLKENLAGLIIMLQSKIIPTMPESLPKESGLIRLSSSYEEKAEAPPSSSFSITSFSSAARAIKLG